MQVSGVSGAAVLLDLLMHAHVIGAQLLQVSFCYLGDTNSTGRFTHGTIARARSAWGRFRELLPLLTNRYTPHYNLRKYFEQLCAIHSTLW